MAGIAGLLQQLRILMAAQRAEGQRDAQLLEQFVSEHDEVAFAGLLERHGPMVLGVCRRILHDEHRAEDAFQATFLVLVRNANAIRKRPSIASWLHGVALRLAQKAQADAVRANRPDARNPRQTDGDVQADASWHETREILDEELQRLPDNYRLPLVLCYLEGKTRDEAAAQLGWTTNQLRGHLERGRTRLRARLLQRGVALSVAAAAPLLTDALLAATVPPLLAVATLHAATRFAAGTTLSACGVSGSVVALTQGGIKMMASKKLIAILAAALFAVALGSGIGIFGQRTEPAEAKQPHELPAPIVALAQPKRDEPKLDRFGDSLPPGAIARLGTMRFRHTDFVTGLAYTPDGAILASGSRHGINIWDAETGKETRRFRVDRDSDIFSSGIAISTDGKTVIEMENGGILRVWDLASGKVLRQIQGEPEEPGFAIALSPDGKVAAKGIAGFEDNKQQVSLWDVGTGKQIRKLGESYRFGGALAFSHDGKLLAAGDEAHTGFEPVEDNVTASSVRVWDPSTGRLIRELKGHTGGVTALAFSPDDKLLASASHDGSIRLWDQNGQLLRSIAVPAEPPLRYDGEPFGSKGVDLGGVLTVAFSPDGRWIASGGHDGCVRLWDAANGKSLHTMPGHGREVSSVVFSPNGKVLASASQDQTIRLWDPVTGKDYQPRQGHHGPLRAIAVSADGKLAAASSTRAIHLWSLGSGEQLRVLRGHTEGIYSVAFSPDGKIVASAGADETIRIWDVANGREARQIRRGSGTGSVAFSGVDNMLLSADYDALRFWDWSKAKELRQIKTDGAHQMSISRDGRIVGAIRLAGKVTDHATIWDVATGKELRRIPERCHLAVAPDGRTFVTQATDGLIRQWNIATGAEQTSFLGPKYSPTWSGPAVLVLSPDSRLVATSHKADVQLWEVATGKLRRRLTGHQGDVVPFVFSPDGRTMLTGGEDTTVLVWDLARRHERQPARLAPADLDALWRDLGGDDAERADRAMGTLAARAEQSVPFLDKHLAPINAADPKRVAALIGDLDSAAFAVREKAAKELQGLRDLATPALKQALAKPSSLETRRRIDDLLAKLRMPLAAGALLQSIRAVEVLERIESAEARRVLRKLATGAPHGRLTQEARAALGRLESSRSGKRF